MKWENYMENTNEQNRGKARRWGDQSPAARGEIEGVL